MGEDIKKYDNAVIMEQKIFNILARMLNKRTDIDDATDQLLHLFSVSKRFNFPNFIAGVMVGILICTIIVELC